jgi:shikimate kinase
VNNVLKGINVFLIGMMGAGKTTVGRLLADKLGYRFVDTDALIERVAGKTINQIFAEDGEDAFRELEAQVLSEISLILS